MSALVRQQGAVRRVMVKVNHPIRKVLFLMTILALREILVAVTNGLQRAAGVTVFRCAVRKE